jgi:aryl-alcohol dehydrogenase-like predicted oxidoreductase
MEVAMQFTQFGRTGLTVSRLCIGTGTFGHQTDESEAFRILGKAADAGVNFIDTADIYPAGATADGLGSSEVITGRWLKGKRDQYILGTKAGGPMGPLPWNRGSSRKHLLDAIDASLRRLDTDYVDLYQLHMDDMTTPLDETVEALDSIVRSGKARYIGVSNFFAYRLALAIGKQETRRLVRFASAQPRYNLLFREIERDLFPLAREEGIAITPFNPLAGGLLSGRYQRDHKPSVGRFSAELGNFGAMYMQRYWHDREFTTIDELTKIAASQNVPLPTLSVAWVLGNPDITSVILGASRAEHLDSTLAATDYVLSGDLRATLDDLTIEYRRGDAGR